MMEGEGTEDDRLLESCDSCFGNVPTLAANLDPILGHAFNLSDSASMRSRASFGDRKELALADQLKGNLDIFAILIRTGSGFEYGFLGFIEMGCWMGRMLLVRSSYKSIQRGVRTSGMGDGQRAMEEDGPGTV